MIHDCDPGLASALALAAQNASDLDAGMEGQEHLVRKLKAKDEKQYKIIWNK